MPANSAGTRVGGILTTSGSNTYAWVLDTEMVNTAAIPNSIGGFNFAPIIGYDGVTQSSPNFWLGMKVTTLGSAAWTGTAANVTHLRVDDFTNIGAGAVTNQRGIAIEDLAEGTSSNIALEIETQTVGHAIVTGTGQIDFGGDIEITSDSVLNVAAHDYLPRSSGSPTFATVDTASVEVTGGAGSTVLFYSVAIPAQKHGELVNVRSITFYYALVNSGQIDFNKWGTHTADGTSAYFDNDAVAIVAGTSHSVSGLSKTLASDETLWFKLSIGSPGATDEATLHGITITYDTD